jgi:hypothetical protein
MAHATAIDERLLSAELGYYVWSFPGSPIKVHLALEVVKGMQAQLRDGGANAAGSGLLLGGISGQTTVVSGFQPLARGDAEEIEQAIVALEKAPGRHSLVGYYRTHREDGSPSGRIRSIACRCVFSKSPSRLSADSTRRFRARQRELLLLGRGPYDGRLPFPGVSA